MHQGRDAGLKVIIGYKFTKAVVEVLLGLSLCLYAERASEDVRRLALHFRDHASSAWSLALAERLWSAASGRHLLVIGAASLLDGVLSSIEGWALHRRYRWGDWLVIAATSCLLPFEVSALARRFTAGRVVALVVNAAIVLYLVQRRRTLRAE